jgi:hypothetical protein
MSKTVKLNIPEDIAGWRAIREEAKLVYWGRRKDGATENEALYSVLDHVLRDDGRD